MQESQLIGPGHLAVTTGYRDVLSEILVKQLNSPATQEIFLNDKPYLLNIMKQHRMDGCTAVHSF